MFWIVESVGFTNSLKTVTTIYHTMKEPIMLYCAPIYLGITSYHQKLAQIESKASKIINSDMTKPIVSKLKDRSATEVVKYISGGKKNTVIQFQHFNHKISTRGNGSRLIIPKTNIEAGRLLLSVQGALLFNKLPEKLWNEKSLITFKNMLRDYNFNTSY